MSDIKSNKIATVILAGKIGSGLHSTTSLLLHPISGQPMILYAVNAAYQALGDYPILVLEEESQQFRQIAERSTKHIVYDSQLSSIQILRQIEHLLEDTIDTLLVLRADMPLLTCATIERFVSAHLAQAKANTPLTLLTFHAPNPQNFDRLDRDQNGTVVTIMDQSRASRGVEETTEYGAGIFCFSTEWLWQALSRLPSSPQDESRITDLIQIATTDDLPVRSVSLPNPDEALRVDSYSHLAQAEGVIRQRINQEIMQKGVILVDPNSTYIDLQVEIGVNTVIHPNSYLRGASRIGNGCTIGPNSLIVDTLVGDRCKILFSVTENAVLEDDVDIGPFAHLRKGAHLAQGVHMGNYGEVKNSYLGPGTKMGHFSYIGDANIGPGVNIGAGVITANFDGEKKHPTEIGAGAFIGSDTMLIAPVKIGAGARTGAGSVVTKDVPPNSLAVGVPARVIRKKEERDES
jgi:bifunctional UDP-N-acetylglucosamine pyrophosphorylase/glucosamine-1-phosphate N-acetyltransferase